MSHQNPANPVRTLPSRKQPNQGNDFGEEMNSDGSDTPRTEAGGPAHVQQRAAAPPPQKTAASNNRPAQPAHQPQHPQQAPAAATSQQPKSKIPQYRKRSKYSRRNIALANGRSNNRVFAIVHPLHIAVIVFGLTAIGMMSAAAATDNWYVVTDGTTLRRVGLFKACDGNSNCKDIDFADMVTSLCTRKGDDLKAVNTGVQALGFAGIAFSFLSLIVSLIARHAAQSVMSIICIVVTILALASYSAALGVFVYHKENWEFCGKSFCQFIESLTGTTRGCDASYGYSLGLVAIALGAAFFGSAFAILRVVFREWNIVEDTQPTITTEELAPQRKPARATAAHVAREPYPDADCSDVEPVEADPGEIPPPPDGDWVYDEECGMYWSESEFLFLDPFTNHSYDPNSDMWYDPDAEEWYQGEQMDEGQS